MTPHRFSDELRETPRQQAFRELREEPYTFHWTDCIKFVVGVLLVYFGLIALIVIGTAAA